MPDKPTWTAKIPEALESIAAQPDRALWFPADLEGLLDIKRRRAQELIAEAGPEVLGRSVGVARENLILFLKIKGGSELEAQERERRKAFAQKFRKMEVQFVDHPPAFVQPKPEIARRVYRGGFDGLPEGVVLEPGRITLRFRNPDEAKQQLFALAVAMGKDDLEFEKRVRTQNSPSPWLHAFKERGGSHERRTKPLPGLRSTRSLPMLGSLCVRGLAKRTRSNHRQVPIQLRVLRI